MISEATNLIHGLPQPLREAFAKFYSFLVDDSGCEAYVETIYVGFTLGGEMVCAIYPHPDRLEIAMALPEDVEGPEFKDATHLTWPTMPVSIEMRDAAHCNLVLDYLRLRCIECKQASTMCDGRMSTSRGDEIQVGECHMHGDEPGVVASSSLDDNAGWLAERSRGLVGTFLTSPVVPSPT